MQEIHIEAEKAERIIAQMLRDELKVLPEKANALATAMSTRLRSAMASPTKPGLRGGRMIFRYPDSATTSNFTEEVSKRLADIDEHIGQWLWEQVYDRCRDLPSDVVPRF